MPCPASFLVFEHFLARTVGWYFAWSRQALHAHSSMQCLIKTSINSFDHSKNVLLNSMASFNSILTIATQARSIYKNDFFTSLMTSLTQSANQCDCPFASSKSCWIVKSRSKISRFGFAHYFSSLPGSFCNCSGCLLAMRGVRITTAKPEHFTNNTDPVGYSRLSRR